MPQKRKRTGQSPTDDDDNNDNSRTTQQQQQQPSSSPTRRATRQTPVYPPPIPGPSKTVPTTATPVPLPVLPGQLLGTAAVTATKRSRGSRPKSSDGPSATAAAASGAAGLPHSATVTGAMGSVPTMGVNGKLGKENVRPVEWVAPETPYRTAHQTQTPSQYHRQSTGAMGRSNVTAAAASPRPGITPTTTTPVVPPKPSATPMAEKPAVRSDRNIDKVVLGKLCFRTWYPSYYGKEILGDTSGNVRAGTKEAILDAAKAQSSKKEKDSQLVLERLYVCPSCFKYAKEIVAWWGHVSACEKKGHVPGTKVYSHPRGRRKILIAQDGKGSTPGPKKRRGEGGIKYTEQVVQDEGEWSIWEVDGEVDGLFCQNLSLFAKLFLDNKSVFFDVTGFNYFLLVYTPPAKPEDQTPPIPQITGFFSKEKMSWDNNNLACILVFPPWQRKGLGALLMGASYEISKREGVMGGPEKPISDLGKKGYKRFWAGEVARWLLNLDANSVPIAPGGELIIDIDEISQGTWITAEDCLGVLRDMGLVEEAGIGPGKPPKPEPVDETEEGVDEADDTPEVKVEVEEEKDKKAKGGKAASNGSKKKGAANAAGNTAAVPAAVATASASTTSSSSPAPVKMVKRVKVDKEAIRQYVIQHRISLERSCDSAGFVEGYAIKEEVDGMSIDSQYGE